VQAKRQRSRELGFRPFDFFQSLFEIRAGPLLFDYIAVRIHKAASIVRITNSTQNHPSSLAISQAEYFFAMAKVRPSLVTRQQVPSLFRVVAQLLPDLPAPRVNKGSVGKPSERTVLEQSLRSGKIRP